MDNKISKVIFTGDILRPFAIGPNTWESATWKNIRWLEYLIGWQLAKSTQLPQSRVSWEKEHSFDTPGFYTAMGLKMSYEAWASIFYLNTLPESVEEQLIKPFANALVIGVEIPDILQFALARHHIPFIDIVSHPVRFLEDLLFAFRTNDESIYKNLRDYQFNLEEDGVLHANLLRAKATWMPALNLPANTALITGQVATDKALISRQTGTFLKLGDYMDKLFEICESHPLVLFKPHPYQQTHCPSRRAIEAFGMVQTVTNNFYYLMAQRGISDVYAITSGTVTEAPYFGKKGHLFGDPLYPFNDLSPVNGLISACVPIKNAFLQPIFWTNILVDKMPVQSHVPDGPTPRASLLRRSLNADWDYGFMDKVVQHQINVTENIG